ncbi:long-chain-fatty-acid--CoA ligase [Lutimaribacter sp. EGI FJ00015]|uniref:Long-chain-fatty-acid--CoA ligase n=1 Tax=Lutimaribacter degradans TaxID=2945989 RepID=A0ACC5ZWV9_9RHOB|nr:long-chain-fatty-acid--CoA ligase [Lutimaribacter sp. EGI FJ00013]MCM2562531.1 long-chain-fatty-acid--CoA ligase [Lutimaribacter sp. EGI FJ00013]MCO0613688.1 long-chain-fatty-acid--CoA ligase [Lutimaribacter sp. EGI FJ00015]MCO0636829.1 long-chain-fatty-acid--CoA ligase [Lutimaribacter sp. EGI FJ00014]
MKGMMQHRPLLISSIIEHAAEAHKTGEIVSVRTEGDVHRQTYPQTLKRVYRLANALKGLGIEMGDRVATLAWNGYRHFELYYAISGQGAVCHTINPRLSAEQLIYIVNHAEDKLLFLDATFVPIIEGVKDELPKDLRFVIMTDRAHMPENSFDALCYEELLEDQPESFDWPVFDEDTAAALCYTSGTTGNPKGALYSHRSTLLHALMLGGLVMGQSIPAESKVMPVVPLFHVNAWGLPYASPMLGYSLVMPGPALDGESLFRLMDTEGVYSAWGVPTVWQGLLAEIEKQGRKPEGFADIVVGGSAAPRKMIETFEKMGVHVGHAWGMTEMSPIGTHGNMPKWVQKQPFDRMVDLKAQQGRRAFGVDLKIVDEDGNRLPHDGKAVGELYVRGNTIVSGYFKNDEATAKAIDSEGWFGTGDIASIDDNGILNIQDRSKDLIKSGGEWISSIDLENAAMSHPGVASCAAIAMPHPKWDERPVLVAVAAGTEKPSLDELHQHMLEHFAKWQLPDDVIWAKELPLTATGKVSKLTLRQTYADYKLPDLR